MDSILKAVAEEFEKGKKNFSNQKFTQALGHFEEVLKILHHELGRASDITAPIHINIALIYIAKEEWPKASHELHRALALLPSRGGIETRKILGAISHNLGFVNIKLGKKDEAFSYLKKALRIRERTFGENHIDTAATKDALGCLLCEEMSYGDALELFESAVHVREELLGTNHPDTAKSWYNLAKTLTLTNKTQKALFYAKKAVDVLQPTLGQCNHTILAKNLKRRLERNAEKGKERRVLASEVIRPIPRESNELTLRVEEEKAKVVSSARESARISQPGHSLQSSHSSQSSSHMSESIRPTETKPTDIIASTPTLLGYSSLSSSIMYKSKCTRPSPYR
ncbi:hypothetical protein ADUPG1_009736 [Aduncisulcus paluster]|uniref:Kinesin light chain n=1 Tax=Aduncisulcus paluster TaxID=2918883 RepID=A0ABQ5KXS7_9EUKA|nr:hypothetical protein ADUPG1_009736 [Aduncisulcus paluster]